MIVTRAATFKVEVLLGKDESPAAQRVSLEQKYRDGLRDLEREKRRAIEKLYLHRKIEVEEERLELPPHEKDLFSEVQWKVFGLPAGAVVWGETIGGATVGGLIDASVGGSSFLMGTIFGGLTGLVHGAWVAAKRMPTAKSMIADGLGKKVWNIGPHPNPQFFWIVLDRALCHYRAVRDRSHGRRDTLSLKGLLRELDKQARKPLEKIAARIRKAGEASAEDSKQLADAIEKLL